MATVSCKVPWCSKSYKGMDFLQRLHEEIVDFCTFVAPTEEEHRIREDLVKRLTKVFSTLWPNSEVMMSSEMPHMCFSVLLECVSWGFSKASIVSHTFHCALQTAVFGSMATRLYLPKR